MSQSVKRREVSSRSIEERYINWCTDHWI